MGDADEGTGEPEDHALGEGVGFGEEAGGGGALEERIEAVGRLIY